MAAYCREAQLMAYCGKHVDLVTGVFREGCYQNNTPFTVMMHCSGNLKTLTA